ncbi:hypothetical protein GQX74_012408 [Glossina fuscipes]|nr:hypothetical protein GQX74_012408 [Glossina fuscipes]
MKIIESRIFGNDSLRSCMLFTGAFGQSPFGKPFKMSVFVALKVLPTESTTRQESVFVVRMLVVMCTITIIVAPAAYATYLELQYIYGYGQTYQLKKAKIKFTDHGVAVSRDGPAGQQATDAYSYSCFTCLQNVTHRHILGIRKLFTHDLLCNEKEKF